MSSDQFNCRKVFFVLNVFLYKIDDNNFRINTLKVTPGQLKDHPTSSNWHYSWSSFDESVIQQIFCFYFSQFTANFHIILIDPFSQPQIQGEQFVVHLTCSNSEQQKVMMKNKRWTLGTNDIFI